MGKEVPVPIIMFKDSKYLFDTITRLTKISEKRLLIDVAALTQSYVNGELFKIGHVSSFYNLADPLTKKANSKLLEEVMLKGMLPHPVNQWLLHHDSEHSVLVKEKGPHVMSESNKTPSVKCKEHSTSEIDLIDKKYRQ